MTPAISLRDIGKRYKVSPSRSSLLKEALSFGRVKRSHDFWALQDVSFDVEQGSTLGVLGRNGAGKSTLLKIISGVSQPTTGEASVNGRLAAIFSTGAGFNPEFTGRENVMLNGLILGIDHDELVERFDSIAAFADIGEFIDQPIKTYSSGMRSRLGFAVAVNVDADVLVLDEALSAGDAAFKKKALQRMYDLRDSGTTVLFVSHSLGMVKRFCTEAVLLHKGRLLTSGSPDDVVARYRELLDEAQKNDAAGTAGAAGAGTNGRNRELDYAVEHEDEEDTPFADGRDEDPASDVPAEPGTTGEAEILGVEVLDGAGERIEALPSGSDLTVRARLRYAGAVEESILGIALRSKRAGVDVYATDTALEGAPLGPKGPGEEAAVDFSFGVPLQPGTYTVGATVSAPGDRPLLARAQAAASFKVTRAGGAPPARALVRLPTRVEVLTPENRGNPGEGHKRPAPPA